MNELRNLLTRMENSGSTREVDLSSKIDNLTRAELNRTMTDWSQRLQTLLESERSKNKHGDANILEADQIKLKVTARLQIIL